MSGAGLRVLGHPLHAMLSHFPMALLTVAPALDVLSFLRPGLVAPAVSFWTLAAGLAMAIPTAGAGFVDYLALPDDTPAARTAVFHMAFILAAATPLAVALFLRAAPSAVPNLASLILEVLGAALLGVGGWFGGELVFRHD